MKVRHLKTQNNIYNDHLTTERPSMFDRFRKSISNRSDYFGMTHTHFPTNFSLVVHSPYLFVVVHLKKTLFCKNRLGINIPDLCIFDGRVPYDVFYSQGGDIKTLKAKESLPLKEVYTFFKNRSFEAGTKKEEMSMACFENQEFLIMSDADMFITTRKHKSDPFFKKLLYLRNKLNLTGALLQIFYDESVDCQFAAAATECFSGYLEEEKMLLQYGEDKYLKYCNQKIAMFLNYEQNIRIKKATFCYSKTQSNQYFLTNVKQIEFHNLTSALQNRQKRLLQREAERNKILQMSAQKYERYKSEQGKPLVQELQVEMNSELFKITNKLSLKSAINEVIQEKKTEAAFRKLYPKKHSIPELITKSNFVDLKGELLHDNQKRKLVRPSKFMKKYYKLDSRIRATYTHLPVDKSRTIQSP